jgi:EAL domain-containing protein (putative c-di-GMP-specific phosphodiesterase class I)
VTGIDPDLLKLELTETAVIDNMDDVINKMLVLKKMGVRVSLDDFGIGHSSLVYLKKLPVTQIKIDQSFVHDVLTDSNDAAIIKMVLAVGNTIHCDIIAEGVEQREQFELLKEFGCCYFQGFYFSKPLPVKHFEMLVEHN